MAKDTAEDPSFDADAIGKLIKKAKTSGTAYPFAFGLAGKPEECGFLPHLRKPGKALKQDLKNSSKAIKKVCFGTFTMQDNDLRLMSGKPVKGIVRQLKVRFRGAGMGKIKPMLVGPDGAEIDEDALPDADQFDDSDDDAKVEAPAQPEAQDTGAAALKARLVAVKTGLADVPEDKRPPMVAAFQTAVTQMGKADLDGAGKTITALETALGRMRGAAPAAPAADPKDAFKALVAQVQALPAQAQGAVMPQLQQIKALLAAGDTAAAEAAMADTRAAMAPPSEQADIPPIQIWNTAKETADTGLSRLQNALRGQKHPALQRIADQGLAGLTQGSKITPLTAALMDFNTAKGPARAQAATTALAAVAAFRSFIMDDPMVAHWENNPFGVDVALRGVYGPALDQIEKDLRAAV